MKEWQLDRTFNQSWSGLNPPSTDWVSNASCLPPGCNLTNILIHQYHKITEILRFTGTIPDICHVLIFFISCSLSTLTPGFSREVQLQLMIFSTISQKYKDDLLYQNKSSRKTSGVNLFACSEAAAEHFTIEIYQIVSFLFLYEINFSLKSYRNLWSQSSISY